jgi:septal ring factor EnvC (AmiA/AmiB activator)
MTRRLLAILAVVLALEPAMDAGALAAPSGSSPVSQLKETERALEQSQSRQRLLASEAAALQREQRDVSAKLIEAAAQIRAREALVVASQEEIESLGRDEAALLATLAARNDDLAGLLAGLVSLERNPPPALLASPSDALKALRAAMLFGTAVPALRAEAAALSRDIARLAALRSAIFLEGRSLAANLEKLRLARLDLEGLYERKAALLAATGDALSKERRRAAELAEKAKSLQELLDALAAEARRREAAAKEAAGRLAVKPPAVTEMPPPAFSKSLGRLDYPAQGQLVRRFGDADGFGGEAKGIFIATRVGAQVVAPAAGRVAFAGVFRSYGQLLILDVGEGYHVLLAGMARIVVETGHSIAAGEPVGEMGDAPAHGMIGGQLQDPRPVIYIEFRKAGSAVDPSGWWIGSKKEARNQKGTN